MQKNFIFRLFFCLFFANIFFACSSSNENGIVVAEAFEYKLYKRDLKGIVPDGLSSEDSASIIKNYIRQWVERKVLLEKANRNVDTIRFVKQMEEYKEALTIYEYEQQIVDQLLDTIVSEGEMQKYYTEHSANFLLKDNIIKVLYVKLEKKSAAVKNIKSLIFKSPLTDADKMNLQKYAYNSAANFYLDDQTWLFFNDLLKEIPIETYNQELFLKNNRNINIEDDSFIYLARIIDFKTKESLSPFSLERNNIKAILINKRKVSIVKKMHQDLLHDAEVQKNTKIYDN